MFSQKKYIIVRDVNSTQDLEEKFGDKFTVQADVSDNGINPSISAAKQLMWILKTTRQA
jgi:hypothetical protein